MFNYIKILTAVIALIIGSISNISYADSHHNSQEIIIKNQKVVDDIYMIQGQGGNIGVLRGKYNTILIDSQFSSLSKELKNVISDISKKPISFLLNTHFHFDHTDGNITISDEHTKIIAHNNVRKRLKEGSYVATFAKQTPPADETALPVITYNKTLNLHDGEEIITLTHYPHAHTDGDTVIFFKNANVIHTGDIYFSRMYPFIDTQNGGSIAGYITAMEAIIAISDDKTKIIPGHGELADKATMQKDLQMLIDISEVVAEAKEDELSIKEILELPVIIKYEETYGKSFLPIDKFVNIIKE